MARIILAVDPYGDVGIDEIIARINMVKEYIAGVKIGLPLLIRFGLPGVKKIIDLVRDTEHVILDFKLADIAPVMISTIEPFVGTGANEVIAHAFIGLDGALKEFKEYIDGYGLKLILVVSMSHPGSTDIMDHVLDRIINVVEKLEPYGIVVPATRPHIIQNVKKKLLSKNIDAKIYSPGIGAQGAKPGSALKAGADYEIIGRSILYSPNPLEAASLIARIHDELVRRR